MLEEPTFDGWGCDVPSWRGGSNIECRDNVMVVEKRRKSETNILSCLWKVSRRALGSMQPHILLVLSLFSRSVNMIAHLHLMPRLRMSGDRPPLHPFPYFRAQTRLYFALHAALLYPPQMWLELRRVEPEALEKRRSHYQMVDTPALPQYYQLLSVFTYYPKTKCVSFSLNHALLIREG